MMTRITLMEQSNRKYLYALMGGHLCTDINQGALTAVLPFLVMYDGFSYAEVSLVIFGSTIMSAIVQPLFGVLGDRKARPWVMAVGVFLAGLGMFGIGLAPDLRVIVPSAIISGIGIAMYHPEGGRLANLAVGEHKSRGMSIFAVGGNVGFATGPVLTAMFLGAFGMAGTVVFLVPAIGYALFLLSLNKRFKAFGLVDKKVVEGENGKDRWGMFSVLIASLSIRSIIFYGCLSFIPLFVVGVLGQPEAVGSLMITVYSLVGVAATLLSGRVSEHTGPAQLLACCLAFICGLLLVLAGVPHLPVTVVVVVLIAIAMNLSYPSTVTLSQSFLPNHLGTASGISYGLATCVGGIASPGLGVIGDTFGLVPVFLVMAGAAAVSLAFALIVVRDERIASASAVSAETKEVA